MSRQDSRDKIHERHRRIQFIDQSRNEDILDVDMDPVQMK
jgi:hypothetical protein